MAGDDVQRVGQGHEQMGELVRQRRLAEGTEAEGGERHPELGAREHEAELRDGFLHTDRPAAAARDQLLDAGPPQAHQGEFPGNKEGVGDDQQEDAGDLPGDGHGSYPPPARSVRIARPARMA